jgi:hypothetical protein
MFLDFFSFYGPPFHLFGFLGVPESADQRLLREIRDAGKTLVAVKRPTRRAAGC